MSADLAIHGADAATLPTLYVGAREAIQKCDQIDEVADWSNKAEALSVYAKQSRDDTLRKCADRIRARAVRRVGELLKEIPPDPGRRPASAEIGGDAPTNSPRQQAAESAGLSRDQVVQAVRVANVPADEFDADVDSDDPPTLTELAERGKRPAPRQPDVEADRVLARKTFAAIVKFNTMCATTDPAAVARGITAAERKELLDQAGAVAVWARGIVRELEK